MSIATRAKRRSRTATSALPRKAFTSRRMIGCRARSAAEVEVLRSTALLDRAIVRVLPDYPLLAAKARISGVVDAVPRRALSAPARVIARVELCVTLPPGRSCTCMGIAAGTRLGPYEVVARIGAGGMGEVWKARDTRLERSVAIKVLPAGFATNAQLKTRFEREAKTISQLNHPHICTLYDVGHEQGTDFLVMELLEGESLAERIARGPLPLPDVLRFGAQIADALDRAHRAGIVHRDLKPANVVITKSGAKLLDFGLAKAATIAISPDDPTQHAPLTQEGTIVGTFQYMAPEQLEAQEVDARTDIFALGAVVYEAATGQRAFSGKTRTSVIAAIVSGQPKPLSELQPLTPPAFERAVERCLAKDPDERWQSAKDLADELRWIAQRPAERVVQRSRMPLAAIAIALAVLFVMALAAAGYFAKAPRAVPLVRVPVPVLPNSVFPDVQTPLIALSPDGRTIAYSLLTDGKTRLFVRKLSVFAATALPGTDNATGPFFSPDGRSIGFFAAGALRRVDVDGGPVQTICTMSVFRGGTWAPDGTIYFGQGTTSGLFSVPATGGTPQRLTEPDANANENSHRWPQLLPDGKHILFTVRTDRIESFDSARLALLSLETRKWETVLEGGTQGMFVAPDTLLFARGGNLMAAPFSVGSRVTDAAPRVVLSGVATNPTTGAAHFSASAAGVLVYFPGSASLDPTEFAWVDRKGAREPIATLPKSAHSIRLMPDGHRILMSVSAANNDVWVYDIDRATFTRVTNEAGDEMFPTPCGENDIVFASSNAGGRIMRVGVNGGMRARVVFAENAWPGSCTADGRLLAAAVATREGSRAVTTVPVEPGASPKTVLATHADARATAISPDGKWLAYMGSDGARHEVYVHRLDSERRWQVSIDGGQEPAWSPDGRALFYREEDGDVLEVPFDPNAAHPPGRARVLFRLPDITFHGYDVAPDGRFLIARSLGSSAPVTQLHLVLNWNAAQGK